MGHYESLPGLEKKLHPSSIIRHFSNCFYRMCRHADYWFKFVWI